MTSTHKDNAQHHDVAPAVPMTVSAAFAVADDDKERQRLAESFRQGIEPRPAMPGR